MTTMTEPRRVTARVRKRCPNCRQMIEEGSEAVLTDDRYEIPGFISRMNAKLYTATRGAWHLWHPDCHRAMRGTPTKERDDQ